LVLRLAILAALALAFAQLLMIGRVELTFDEAYYALWARAPQAGYFDHPPLVAWTIWASERLFGDGESGVRGLFWLEAALAPALVGWIGWRLFAEIETAAAAALLYVAAPLAAAAPRATPATPLVFFWTLSLAGLVEVWRGRTAAWGLVGLAAGAAGLAKMTAGFLGAGVALALLATPSLRGQWRKPGPWVAAGLALAVLSPFLIWNAEHGFATFVKQGGRLAAERFAPAYLAEFLGTQALLMNPLTVAVALAAAWRGSGAASEPVRLLAATLLPALLYFAAHALHDRVQGNWPAPLYPALALLAAHALVLARWLWAPKAAAALGLAVTTAAYLHLAFAAPDMGPADPLARVGGWRDLAARVFAQARERKAGFVLAHGYAATSLLTWYGPGDIEVIEAEEPERWTFRAAPRVEGEGLAFGPPGFAEELARRFLRVEAAATLQREVGAAGLERYTLFEVGEGRRSP
jgi:4-amino-4-deoxy-L-arabinose transferase-like glycosyltransferase